ncbi:serine hydrolase [Solwaraspora sp. WMMD937]|uniref:serine hydrolase domain-containing protein n=1 Tax=Solwaraspora sp. WMMD937 TaxID=3016090 RepID=UPI00249BDB96|nr:serine hydrolase domain-containing protein [Solwaraspora sp. WMMD937]WFE21915.1 serine hydrolase [Solwaraspora sp. WMMD937]
MAHASVFAGGGAGTSACGEVPHPPLAYVLRKYLKPTSENPGHPTYAGAVAAITVAMLLTHTSGLPAGANISQISGRDARWRAVLSTGLVNGATPGDRFRYSSVGLMVLGRIIEKVTGQGLADALRTGLTGPLGLADTGFTPTDRHSAADIAARMAATDARSSRGLLGGGSHNGVRILSQATCQRMLTNANTGLPAIDPERPQRTSDHGLGVVLNQPWFMGNLAGPRSFGHTGFSGTSLVVDPDRNLVFALLTNRAHPNWSWANPDPARVAAANIVARDFG